MQKTQKTFECIFALARIAAEGYLPCSTRLGILCRQVVAVDCCHGTVSDLVHAGSDPLADLEQRRQGETIAGDLLAGGTGLFS